MKKLKLLLASILCFPLILTGCNVLNKGSKSSSESEIVEPSSSDTSSDEPSSSEPEDPSDPSEPEVVAKTVEDVVTDINAVFNPLVGTDILSWYEDYGCYIGALNLGAAEAAAEDAEAHQAELQSATEFIAGYLPDYLEAGEAGYETDYDDYYIGLSVDSVGVDLFGYVNGSGNVLVQIQIAELEEAE